MTEHAEELASAFHYLTRYEVAIIKKYTKIVCMKANGRPTLVNIGAGAGTSTMAMREACETARLYSVDVSAGGPFGGLEGEYNEFRKAGLKLPEQLLADSGELGKVWDFGAIDLLFVDGDHSEIGVERDISAWFHNIVIGGYILFHDYGDNNWPAVAAVTERMMVNQRRVEVSSKIAVFEITKGIL